MKTSAIWIALALVGCAHVEPQPTPTPVPGSATCVTACDNGRALQCPGIGPLCVQACLNVDDSGVFSYPVDCMTTARSCAQWDACQK